MSINFLTKHKCPRCREMLVDTTHQGDRFQVMLCTNVRCIGEPLYTIVCGRLVEYCPMCECPAEDCDCTKDVNHER